MGRGDDSQVDFTALEGADGAILVLLQQAEKFDLKIEREVADFVEESGAAIG